MSRYNVYDSELNLSAFLQINDTVLAEAKKGNAKKRSLICKKFRDSFNKRSLRGIWIYFNNLQFEKIQDDSNMKVEKTFEAYAEPCDKDWCNYCRKGEFEKCPNKY